MEITIKIKEQTLVLKSTQAAKVVMRVLEAAGVRATITMQISKNKKNMLITDMILSVRALNMVHTACMEHRGLDFKTITVADFIRRISKEEFSRLRNAGKRCIQELESAFAELGYEWE